MFLPRLTAHIPRVQARKRPNLGFPRSGLKRRAFAPRSVNPPSRAFLEPKAWGEGSVIRSDS
ncbi:hypothetical protein HMPREF9440_00002 [Sutterella parvirubra YIT 11816]|uniref:Uncharacterized protein n=1 Tax=Sutterella parvirubra YIT 11816 TaxID=762967 RepID=H3KBA8_9BURK|nr:hypothetical protein HMPREF9440_00002 [Sutterella parvirubra YIT 11816]